jgi:hypothetical protein
MRADSGQRQEVLMVTVDDYNYEQGLGAAATTAPIFQQHAAGQDKVIARPCLDAKFFPKFYCAKRRFLVTSKYRHMYRVLNVDEIKN